MSKTDMPARIWVTHEKSFWKEGYRTFGASDLDHGDEYPEYIHADLVKEAVKELAKAEEAIREFNRYWHGGETRGSYDGRPEREGLWRSMQTARAALSKLKEAGL